MTPRVCFVLLMAIATAVSVSAQTPSDPGAIDRVLAEAQSLLDTSKLNDARLKFQEARELARAAGERRREAVALLGLGTALYQRGAFKEAEPALREAASLAEASGDAHGLARSRSQLGATVMMFGRSDDARRLFEEALKGFDAAGDRAGRATVLRNMTHLLTIDMPQRMAWMAEAHAIARDLGDARLEGTTLLQWGGFLHTVGRYAEAVPKLDAAARLLQTHGSDRERARSLQMLGRALHAHGHYGDAITRYTQALAVQQAMGDVMSQSQTHGLLTSSYLATGEPARALPHAEQALALARKTGIAGQVNQQQAILGDVYLRLKQYDRAISMMETAVAEEDSPDPAYFVILANAYSRLGRHDAAIVAATRGIGVSERLGKVDRLVISIETRARVYDAAGQIDRALDDARATLQAFERLRLELAEDDFLKRGFGEQRQQMFHFTVGLLARGGRASEAMVVAEQARARAFLDLLATRQQADGGKGGPAGRLRSDASARAVDLTEMRAIAGRLRSTIVSYWVDADATHIWALGADGEVTHRRVVVPASRLETLIGRAWSVSPAKDTSTKAARALTTRGGARVTLPGDPSAAARELHKYLIAPIADVLPSAPGARLTIVPHGALMRLSFALLKDSRGEYLVERFSLHYTPALAAVQFAAAGETRERRGGYLIVANPKFPAALTRAERLPALPGSQREADAIARGLPADRVVLLTGARATESRVRDAAVGRRVVHFATHGIVSDDKPQESFLALASAGGTDDGRLSAEEIYGLDLDADLVVLSACRSGGGKVTGDGMIGLTRAFFYAGTPAVLATLWDLADEPAHYLVPRFYREWERTGDKADALRRAQLALIRALRAGRVTIATPAGPLVLPEHPSLWAGFVLLGNPD